MQPELIAISSNPDDPCWELLERRRRVKESLVIYTSNFASLRRICDSTSVVTVAISRTVPQWYQGARYTKLAPSWPFVAAYKADLLTPDQYTQRYTAEVLDRLNPAQVAEDLFRISCGAPVVLLCYERATDLCHRHLVREWLKAAGYSAKEWT